MAQGICSLCFFAEFVFSTNKKENGNKNIMLTFWKSDKFFLHMLVITYPHSNLLLFWLFTDLFTLSTDFAFIFCG